MGYALPEDYKQITINRPQWLMEDVYVTQLCATHTQTYCRIHQACSSYSYSLRCSVYLLTYYCRAVVLVISCASQVADQEGQALV